MTKLKALLVGAYLFSIALAAFAVTHIGHQYAPGAPHVLPVWPGVEAPSGVYVIGVTLVLRDLLSNVFGREKLPVFYAVLAGAALSSIFSWHLALASGAAFLVSETLDLLVYEKLRKRGVATGMLGSNAVSIPVDSAIFLLIGFGSVEFFWGQVIGKGLATVAAVIVLAVIGTILAKRAERREHAARLESVREYLDRVLTR